MALDLFWFFFRFGFFLFPVLSIFLTLCNILNLEAAISTVFAAFLPSFLHHFHGDFPGMLKPKSAFARC
jgi:hypothetical protein